MKRNKSDNRDYDGSARSARIVSGEEGSGAACDFKLSLDRDASDLNFRKSINGYKVGDVVEYVNEQNQNFLSACQMYDGKVAEMRAEIAFLNRERESLLSKLEEARDELAAANDELEQLKCGLRDGTLSQEKPTGENGEAAGDAVSKNQTVEDVLRDYQTEEKRDRLNDDYRLLVDEVALLRREKVEAQSTITRLAEIASEYEEAVRQCGELKDLLNVREEELEEAKNDISGLLSVERELNVIRDEKDGLKHACELEQKKRAEAEEELSGKAELMSRAATEIEQLRKEISEFEIRQSVLRQQLKKSDEEIAGMREQNKRQAYEYASKISDLESDFNQNKLAVQKQIQVHMYHVKQVDLLINELHKQFGDAKSSLESIESPD